MLGKGLRGKNYSKWYRSRYLSICRLIITKMLVSLSTKESGAENVYSYFLYVIYRKHPIKAYFFMTIHQSYGFYTILDKTDIFGKVTHLFVPSQPFSQHNKSLPQSHIALTWIVYKSHTEFRWKTLLTFTWPIAVFRKLILALKEMAKIVPNIFLYCTRRLKTHAIEERKQNFFWWKLSVGF